MTTTYHDIYLALNDEDLHDDIIYWSEAIVEIIKPLVEKMIEENVSNHADLWIGLCKQYCDEIVELRSQL